MHYPQTVSVIRIKKQQIHQLGKLRYWLEILVNPTGSKVLCYILMNPSTADENDSDKTVNKMIKITERMNNGLFIDEISDIRKIIIVNVFPYYETNSDELISKIGSFQDTLSDDQFRRLEKKNLVYISCAIKKSDYVVLGWGDPTKNMNPLFHRMHTSEIVQQIKSYKKKPYVFLTNHQQLLTDKCNPRYPSSRVTIENVSQCEVQTYFGIIG